LNLIVKCQEGKCAKIDNPMTYKELLLSHIRTAHQYFYCTLCKDNIKNQAEIKKHFKECREKASFQFTDDGDEKV